MIGLRCWLPVLVLLSLAACREQGHSHGSGGHTHATDAETPTVAVTRWTDRTELFMEYPLLVAGGSGRAAIHVTDLADFSPVSEGEAIVAMRGMGRVLEFRGGVSRPGIFGVDLAPEHAGVYAMSLRIETPGWQDVHPLGQVKVHVPGTMPAAVAEEGHGISFLKEQQWTLEFGTVSVARRGIRPQITVPATVQPRSGGEALLTAPVPGRVDPAAPLPLPGTRVRAGTTLARIAPRSDELHDAGRLRADLVEAEQSSRLAALERERARRLVDARAIPSRRLDEAKAALAASSARLEEAQQRWRRFEGLSQSGGGDDASPKFALRAPFDGVVSEVGVTAGESVDADAPLIRLVDPDRVHVVGAVSESLAAGLGEVTGAEFVLGGRTSPALGAPLASSPVIDPVSRTAVIRFALDNRREGLRIGQAGQLRLFLGDEEQVTAIPESAVVDDGGRPVIFVQIGGESFERRPVRLGGKAGGFVEVVGGVEVGERVVHRGAYLVRLAALSTQIPAHGHVH